MSGAFILPLWRHTLNPSILGPHRPLLRTIKAGGPPRRDGEGQPHVGKGGMPLPPAHRPRSPLSAGKREQGRATQLERELRMERELNRVNYGSMAGPPAPWTRQPAE